MTPRPDRLSARRALLVATGIVAGFLLPAAPALAHPGHALGGMASGLAHPLTGPDHLLAMVAVGAVAALATSRRLAWLTPLAFVGGMVAGGALGLAGVTLPGTETAIALSVVALGVLVATAARHEGLWLPLLVGSFGVAHGIAHGAEAPSAASPVAYIAGFVAATVALHVSGMAAGLLLRRTPAFRMAAGAVVAGSGIALLLGA
jgi:urease accessory protein